MKVFWAILGLCMLACAVLVYSEVAVTSNDDSSSDAAALGNGPDPRKTADRDGGTKQIAVEQDDERAALAEELLASASDRESPSGVDPAQTRDTADSESHSSSPSDSSLGSIAPDASGESSETASSSTSAESSVEAEAAMREPETEPATASSSSSEALEPVSFVIEPIKGATLIDSTFARKPDGSLLVDDRYVIRGEGTKDKPYEISWDMLISASQSYQPRLGETALPGRIAMLHEKHVRITGYLAFPITAETFDEMLVMLNQWDGCCIGVPPSPYDAIEVKLAQQINMKKRHMFVYGSVEGRLLVEPYLINEWLVGLYLMQEAKVELDY
jgi:hypothetical protein